MFKRKVVEKNEETEKLKEELSKVQEEMAATLYNFENTTEPELLDYYTYFYKAEQIKYGYILKKLKKVYYNKWYIVKVKDLILFQKRWPKAINLLLGHFFDEK